MPKMCIRDRDGPRDGHFGCLDRGGVGRAGDGPAGGEIAHKGQQDGGEQGCDHPFQHRRQLFQPLVPHRRVGGAHRHIGVDDGHQQGVDGSDEQVGEQHGGPLPHRRPGGRTGGCGQHRHHRQQQPGKAVHLLYGLPPQTNHGLHVAHRQGGHRQGACHLHRLEAPLPLSGVHPLRQTAEHLSLIHIFPPRYAAAGCGIMHCRASALFVRRTTPRPAGTTRSPLGPARMPLLCLCFSVPLFPKKSKKNQRRGHRSCKSGGPMARPTASVPFSAAAAEISRSAAPFSPG